MSSFDSKWGDVPTVASEKKKSNIIVVSQFVITLVILLTLQPPFIFTSPKDEYSSACISYSTVIFICILSTLFPFFMSDRTKPVTGIFNTGNSDAS